jgi:hypothetical protein
MALDYTDHTIKKMIDTAVDKLKHPRAGASTPTGFHDHAKPGLDYDPPAPSTIGKVRDWPKRITIPLPK